MMNELTGRPIPPAIQAAELSPSPYIPPSPPAQQVDPKDVETSHGNLNGMIDSILSLTSRPPGQLTKKDVFASIAGLLGKGLFPTPEGRAAIIGQAAQLPEDEAGIRQALGAHLMSLSEAHQAVSHAFPAPNAA